MIVSRGALAEYLLARSSIELESYMTGGHSWFMGQALSVANSDAGTLSIAVLTLCCSGTIVDDLATALLPITDVRFNPRNA